MIVKDVVIDALKYVKINGEVDDLLFFSGRPLPVMGSFVEHVWMPSLGRGTVVSHVDHKTVRVLWTGDEDGLVPYPGGKAIKFINSEEKDGELHMHFTATVAKPINYIKMTYKVE